MTSGLAHPDSGKRVDHWICPECNRAPAVLHPAPVCPYCGATVPQAVLDQDMPVLERKCRARKRVAI